ncbi:signal peptidase I [Kitasatospora cinereorecta]|uniref:Signal peptidase I n=1 Tax=Kitasatospora cinereorecta TaxID=285560 RepID=A0ABW0VN19_9ACTN
MGDQATGGAGPGLGSAEASDPAAATTPGKARTKRRMPFWQEAPVLVVVALALALLIKTFLVQAFVIPSGSMMNTLGIGNRVVVDKLTPHLGSGPSRGEVVVFHDPSDWLGDEPAQKSSGNPAVRGVRSALGWIGLLPSPDEKDLIKRVIAVGGDTVSCQGTGPVYVNGKPLDEPYLYPGATPCGDRNFGPLTVPAGSIWVMGDHRNDSRDSRYHMDEPGGGSVPVDKVIGRAMVVVWPVGSWKTLPIPDTFARTGIGSHPAGTP